MESNETARLASLSASYKQTAATDENGGDDSDTDTYTVAIEDSSNLYESRYRLLVPVLGGDEIDETERIVRIAATIGRARDGDLLLSCLVSVPEQGTARLRRNR